MSTAGNATTTMEGGEVVKKIENFDDILPHVGGAGCYQWILFFLLLPFAFVYAFLYFAQFFITLTPEEHWCTVPELNGWNLTDEQKIALSIPISDATGYKSADDNSLSYSRCEMYDVNFTESLINGNYDPDPSWPKTPCRHGWTFNHSDIPYVSIAAEIFQFQLEWVCGKSYYSSLSQSIFYIGSIIGGFVFSFIADNYGRLPALVACNAVGFFSSIGTAFSDSFWSFCLCRFIAGTAFDNCFNIIFIILIEYVGPQHRTFMANMSFGIYFSGSASLLPWLAYYIADWRILCGVTAVPMISAFFAPWIVPESARWYISSGNIPKAVETLKNIAKVNGKTVEKEIFVEFEESCNKMIKNEKLHNYTVLDLFKKIRLAYITVMLNIYWLIILIVYDGHVWNMKSLDPDVFTSFSLGALTEFPAAIFLTLYLDKWGRRWMSFISMMICGVFSFITLAMPPGAATVTMGIIARFGVNIAGNIGFQYAAEMLPTVVRAQGVSLIHTLGYIAHIIGPYVVYLSDVSPSLPLTVLGLLSVTVAIQSLFMPETLGQDLPQTLQDGNDFGREQSFWWIPCISSSHEKKEKFRKPVTSAQ
ncbi:carcinine transporter-like isoform X1 [Neodiprion virginianus]|uniref:carcinine transporter-like isoform X1 n=1 Tax=Neodiprion virginianus TaxID=2961670 RepID=UPI001EE77529|nr:carcinine transporter-like isoform X1 [Neodiprion virginianus]XP_046622087.1 carcinine transporter-like isoform X1 [Neodiprion virginianus]